MSTSQDTRQFDPGEWRKTLIQMGQKGETELSETIAKLEKVLEGVDSVRFFVACYDSGLF